MTKRLVLFVGLLRVTLPVFLSHGCKVVRLMAHWGKRKRPMTARAIGLKAGHLEICSTEAEMLWIMERVRSKCCKETLDLV